MQHICLSLQSEGIQIDDERLFRNIGARCTKTRYLPGEVIVHVGDRLDRYYYLKEGLVRLYLTNDSSEILFYDIGAGSSFGEAAFFSGEPARVRVVTLEESMVYTFSRDTVMAYLNLQDEFIRLLLKTLSSKVYHITRLFENMSNTDSMTKLLKVLYLLSRGGDPSGEIKVTHEELALMVGTHRVTVTRNLSKLKKEGVISTNRSSIIIKDAGRLGRFF